MSSRFDVCRYTITGTLTNDTALHIGSHHDLAVDMPVSRDGADQVIIPGTSLAGALREAWSAARADDAAEVALWGGRAQTSKRSQGSAVSKVVIEDARVVGGGAGATQVPTEVRNRTAIDPQWGTAEPGKLFSLEVLPAGQHFDFRATVDLPCRGEDSAGSESDSPAHVVVPSSGSAHEPDLELLLDILTNGFSVGSGSTSGLGRMHLVDKDVTVRKRAEWVGLVKLLGGAEDRWTRPPATSTGAEGQGQEPESSATAVATRLVEIPWHPVGPLLIADTSPGEALDTIPLVTAGPNDCVHLLIPGTSIKGALRAQAERICNTMLGYPVKGTQHDVITVLFGSPPTRGIGAANQGRRGSVEFLDVVSTVGWPRAGWVSAVGKPKMTPEEKSRQGRVAPVWNAINTHLHRCACSQSSQAKTAESAKGDFRIADHVAIDRWTGGAKDSALFTVLEPWLTRPGEWQPIRVILAPRLAALARESDPADGPEGHDVGTGGPRGDKTSTDLAALALLWLTLRDLHEGYVGIGFGTTRGCGSLRTDTVGFNLPKSAETAWQQLIPGGATA